MSNDRAGYSLLGIDYKFLNEESLFLALCLCLSPVESYLNFFSTIGAPTVEPIDPPIGQGIPFQESIANFLYFSRKAYFWRLIMFILKSRRLLC